MTSRGISTVLGLDPSEWSVFVRGIADAAELVAFSSRKRVTSKETEPGEQLAFKSDDTPVRAGEPARDVAMISYVANTADVEMLKESVSAWLDNAERERSLASPSRPRPSSSPPGTPRRSASRTRVGRSSSDSAPSWKSEPAPTPWGSSPMTGSRT